MRREKILAIFANPKGTDPLRLGEEDRVIHECLKLARKRRFDLAVRHAATVHDVRRALLEEDCQVVHFSGHGTGIGLILEDERGDAVLVEPLALAKLLSRYSFRVHTIVLNACYSNVHAVNLDDFRIPFVIAMNAPISDRAAIEFTRGFYDALANGRSSEFAFEEGCVNLQLLKLNCTDIPVFHRWTAAAAVTMPERSSDHSFYLFITGANSVGKSTIADEVARHFGFEAIIPADAIRAGLRPWARQMQKPELLWSSFEVAERLANEGGEDISVEAAFERQCAAFCVTFDAVLQHSRRKRATAVFEGVNLLPTEVFKNFALHERTPALIVALFIESAATHYSRMLSRIAGMPAPDADKYPRNFDKIRRIDALIRDRTTEFARSTITNRVMLIENSGPVEDTASVVSQRVKEIWGALLNTA